jgi:TolA-binding protein
MKSIGLSLALLLGLPALAAAQDQDSAELKRRILEKVREKLASERAALLKRVEKIVDEELAKDGPAAKGLEGDAKAKELERKLKALEEEKERVAAELAKAKREAGDEALKKLAQKDGPHDGDDAQQMFDEALKLHEEKNFKESVPLFKRIYYNFPKSPIGVTSAYNVACGYALAGQKEEALDWLETSVKAGFSKIDHIRKDTDLDSLRNEKRYKRLLTDR